jgi:HSP20 family protein
MVGLIKWHKREMDNIRKELDEFFDRWFENLADIPQGNREWKPCLDVSEARDEIVVRVELPGLEAEDLDISVRGHLLTIKGNKRREECLQDELFRCVERLYGSFSRTIELPYIVDADRISATFKNGILTVTMPKWSNKNHEQRTIQVK